ncbi:dipeptidyl aminopeptidase [Hysterangium stoloniferum]|nr:dipeptidyl aminopeptidase [Hysterangium stoloniferum]
MVGSNYQPLPREDDTESAHQGLPRDGVNAAKDDPVFVRPLVYYNDGRFSPPSSVEESEETLLDQDENHNAVFGRGDNDIQDEESFGKGYESNHKHSSPIRYLLICLATILGLGVAIALFSASSFSGKTKTRGLRHITMDHIFNGTFRTDKKSLNWVPEAGDGVFSINEFGLIKLVDLKTNSTTVLLRNRDVRDANGLVLYWSDWKLSPDMNYILFKANYRKQWRWSSFGNYYIHRLSDHSTYPMVPPSDPSKIAYATWSPTGDAIAFVSENDLYVLPSADVSTAPIRVTSTGNTSLFNGVPDWVYEEEVFSADSALWWSPDSSRIAFLRSDETEVNEYTFPIYNPTTDAFKVNPYTDFVTMKYPKPGYPNPLVSVHVFDLHAYQNQIATLAGPPNNFTQEVTWIGRRDPTDSIIQEVTWLTDTTLLIKEVSRAADAGSVVVCNLATQEAGLLASGTVVRRLGKDGEEGDEGWIEASQTVYRLSASVGLDDGAYLDIVPTKDGFNHIALFNPASSSTPTWLTSGQEEVTQLLTVDTNRKLLYYLTAGQTGTGRKLLSASLPANTGDTTPTSPIALTTGDDAKNPPYYSADFSPEAGFYLLSYNGPHVPWQRLVKVGDPSYDNILTDNARLNTTVAEYFAPDIIYSTIENDGYEFNTVEIRPPHMDISGRTQYPVLFRVYGGPGSQTVDTQFNRDWHHFLACTLQYIVVVVDGRGTGYKGRQLRNPSYGGFMAAKVVEADAGVHSLAMSVAPVTSWLLYDTIYTERYMGLPQTNEGGYVNASISNVTAFNHVDYLLAHGSGDDNVHFANTAHLLDMFTASQVRGYSFRMFTDSDHSINTRGANREVYEFLTSFLTEKWGNLVGSKVYSECLEDVVYL